MFLHLSVFSRGERCWLPSMHREERVGFRACTGNGGVCIQRRGFCIHGGLHPVGDASRGVCLQGRLGRPLSEIHGILRDKANQCAVRILLECILVNFKTKLESKTSTDVIDCFRLTLITFTEFRYTSTNIIRLKFKQN